MGPSKEHTKPIWRRSTQQGQMADHWVGGGLYPGSLTGTCEEDTDTQEAPDDIRECLHGLMHTRLSMCMLGLLRGKWSDAPGSQTPAVPVNTVQIKDLLSPLNFVFSAGDIEFRHFYTVSFLFLLKKTLHPEEVLLGKSLSIDPQESCTSLQHCVFFFTEIGTDQSPNLPPGAGCAPPLWCNTINVVE